MRDFRDLCTVQIRRFAGHLRLAVFKFDLVSASFIEFRLSKLPEFREEK